MDNSQEKRSDVFVSPVDWYIAGIMTRFEVIGENNNNLNNRCLDWEIII